MIDTNDDGQVKRAEQWTQEKVGPFWSSETYLNFWDRYQNRIAAYYRRHLTSAPAWRSKLYFPTFFLGCKALEIQFKQTHKSDPFVWVKPADNARIDAEAKERAAIAHADLNYDIQVSNFLEKKTQMDWYVTLVGVGVGREYLRIRTNRETLRQVVPNQYGFGQGIQESEQVTRTEMTCTQVVHPLNFAHELDAQNFMGSRWGAVRYTLHISQIYAMRGNPQYYQPGVEAIIAKHESNSLRGISVGNDTYYTERLDEMNATDLVVVDEYCGPVYMRGNESDQTEYLQMRVKACDATIMIVKNPFKRKPYWKVQAWPDPDGPFGVGPCDVFLPINYWENSTKNQYVDYMNSALKYMYLVNPGAISGGMNALINGAPFGLLLKEKGDNLQLDDMIQTLNRQGSIPPVGDVIQMIERAKQEVGPASNYRGQESQQMTDKATGIALMARREDAMMEGLQEAVDMGIQDGCLQKIQNRTDFFSEPRYAKIDDKELPVEYYPFELAGLDYSVKVKRRLADVEAAKNVSFMKLLGGLDQLLAARGTPLPVEVLIDAYERIAVALGVDGADEIFQSIKKVPAPVIGGPSGAAVPPAAPGGVPQMPQMPKMPGAGPGVRQPGGVESNALAMA